MKRKNTMRLLKLSVITLLCTALNLLGIWIAGFYQLPFWLDTVGVCLAAYYTNFPLTLVSVVLCDIIVGISVPQILYFIPANMLIACAIWLCVHWGHLKALRSAMMSSFVVGLLSIALYTPMDLRLHNGLTLNIWGDALADMLQVYDVPYVLSVVAAEAAVNIVDKQLCILLGFLVIQISRVIRKHLPSRKVVTSSLCLLLALLTIPPMGLTAHAENQAPSNLSDYVQTIYDNTNGLPSASVNMVATTPDGSVWVGSYAGLCRCNGTDFTYITEGRITSVTTLLTDRQGRLWVGTNDRGIAIWENEHFRFLTRDNGLPDNSIRSIIQQNNGDMLVGTAKEMCTISSDVKYVKALDTDVSGVWSAAQNDIGLTLCVDYSGTLSLLKEGRLLGRREYDDTKGRYSCVLSDGNDFLVGTSSGQLYRTIFNGYKLDILEQIDTADLHSINRMKFDSHHNLWLCANNGAGYITPKGDLVMLRYPGFDNALQDMVEDYQGNFWLTSTRSGLMKLSRSPFADLYSYLGLESASVNAVVIHDNLLISGTDKGLQIVDESGALVENALTQAVGKERVRCVREDSKGNIWVCSYGGGLLFWDGGETVRRFTRDQDGAAGDYFRCLQEMPDGTMVAGGSEGLTFIKDGQVVHMMNEEQGLDNTQILCMTLGPNGELYAGSDGSGIYVIEDGVLTKTITERNGLSSRIILRIIPYQGNYFVVTSNSLNYMKGYSCRILEGFPYLNNFDIVMRGEKAWVLSSTGIFVLSPSELLKQDGTPMKFQLYNHRNGLKGSLTANSWVDVDNQGRLYLCSNLGVQRIDMDLDSRKRPTYKMAFRGVYADGNQLLPKSGIYHLDADVDRLEINAAVYNYDPEDLQLRFYLKGLDKNPPIIRQSDLDTITYRNIPHGTYKIQLEVLDEQGNVIQFQTTRLEKQARMWENGYFKVYLIILCTWLVIFATWVIMTLRQMAHRKRELEVMRHQLEEQVESQTKQLLDQAQKLTDMQQHTIMGMATLIEARDGSTGAHVRNTGVYAKMIAEEMQRRGMYPNQIDDNFVDTMGRIAPLHDVGKIKVSDLILNKPGRLTDEEYAIMKSHAPWGGEIIGQILSEDMDPETLQLAKDIATCHHERWDGRGYPAGLAGMDIPLCARIMAVADVFDALNSKRVYKQGMDIDVALDELVKNEGTQFQKEIVEVFVSLKPRIQEYLDSQKA